MSHHGNDAFEFPLVVWLHSIRLGNRRPSPQVGEIVALEMANDGDSQLLGALVIKLWILLRKGKSIDSANVALAVFAQNVETANALPEDRNDPGSDFFFLARQNNGIPGLFPVFLSFNLYRIKSQKIAT